MNTVRKLVDYSHERKKIRDTLSLDSNDFC